MNTKIHEKILYKDLSYQIQGCFFDIRKEYGAGQKETIYVNLLKECLESKRLKVENEKQLYHYLRNSQYELGYLVNFSTARLFIKRIIYTNDKKPFLKTK